MSHLVLQMQTSIDGYVSSTVPVSRWQLWDWGPDWTWSPDLRAFFNRTFEDAAAILLSSVMLEDGYRAHWGRMAQTHSPDPDWRFASRITELPVYVASRGGHEVAIAADVRAATGPLERTIPAILAEVDGPVLCFGGAGLGRALLNADQVDELQLFVNPGIAGDGERIFSTGLARRHLAPLSTDAYECGIVVTRWGRG